MSINVYTEKRQIFIVFYFLILFQSCRADNNGTSNIRFIEKHGKEHFDDFKNYSASLRSYDWNNNPIILVYNDTVESGDCKFPYRVIIDSKNHHVKSFDKVVAASNSICPIDTALMINLALKFEQLKIIDIDVDDNRNVHIKTTHFEGMPNLIRFDDLKHKTDKYKDWKHLRDNWYELPR